MAALLKSVVLLALMLSVSDALLFGGATCSSKTSCESCAAETSWDGFHCRWCPATDSCHAHLSVANKCSNSQKIIKPSDCKSAIAKFNPTIAREFFNFAAAAYSDEPELCLNSSVNGDFELVGEPLSANCSNRDHKCAAFVAISRSQKAIVVAFRGSEGETQVFNAALNNIGIVKVDLLEGAVYRIFYNAYTSLEPQLYQKLLPTIRQNPEYDLWITGHSLGAAMGSILGAKLVSQGIVNGSQVKFIGFGMPRVGTYNYATSFDKLIPYGFRVVHRKDLVSHLPPCFSLAGLTPCTGAGSGAFAYHHSTEVFYDNDMTSAEAEYKVCQGKPANEDKSCSNRHFPIKLLEGVGDHVTYFGKVVSDFGKLGCI